MTTSPATVGSPALVLACGLPPDLTRRDADADAQLEPCSRFGGYHVIPDRQRGANGPLGVVLMGDRRPKNQPRPTASPLEFSDQDHPVPLRAGDAEAGVIRNQQRPHVLDVQPLGHAREPQIDEDDGDHLPDLTRRCGERCAALEAEAGAFRVFDLTGGAPASSGGQSK